MGLRSEVVFQRKKQEPARETLYRLLIGIVILGTIEEIVLLIVCKNRIAATFGLLLGLWTAVVNSIYIYRTLGRALELDEKNSVRAIRGSVIIRYCFMGIAIALALWYPRIFSPAGVIPGLFSMKISAYVQPFFMRKGAVSIKSADYNDSGLPDDAGISDTQPFLENEEEEESGMWGFGIFHNQPKDIPDISSEAAFAQSGRNGVDDLSDTSEGAGGILK